MRQRSNEHAAYDVYVTGSNSKFPFVTNAIEKSIKLNQWFIQILHFTGYNDNARTCSSVARGKCDHMKRWPGKVRYIDCGIWRSA